MTRKLGLVFTALWLFGLPHTGHPREYARMARLSYVDGHVSFMHPNEVDWAAASVNLALQPGDRVYTGSDGRAEIEFDEGSVLRLAEKTDVELTALGEERVQIRILVGLCTLTARGDVPFEIGTPVAMFDTRQDGVYRFDVTETGASDGIVRKGRLGVSGRDYSERLETGELMHVEADDQGSHLMSRYESRDDWDEWTDRRTADLLAYESRRYLPETVYIGVSDLDRYGRWVNVDSYGWGWVPYAVGPGWSPYWDGRWCYRPFWGWTWVSYEPWGWLPYHYGRWHFSAGFGWSWLPGPSLGFNFWSPGLVRFYHGPSWVSWVPLGPGDYYNVHGYCYSPRYSHHLNSMRLAQHRGPDDLANRHIPGAFRTAPTDDFVNGRGGRGAGSVSASDAAQPWRGSRMVTDRLEVAPTARSFMPVAERQAETPAGRTPAAARGGGLDAASREAGRSVPGGNPSDGGTDRRSMSRAVPGNSMGERNPATDTPVSVTPGGERGSQRGESSGGVRIWNRVANPSQTEAGRALTSGAEVRGVIPRSTGRSVPGAPGETVEGVSKGNDAGSVPSAIEHSSRRGEARRNEPGNRTDSFSGSNSDRSSISTRQSAAPSYQRYGGSGASSVGRSDRGTANPGGGSETPSPVPSRPVPRSYYAEPRTSIESAQPSPGRWQSYGGGSSPSFSRPSWQAGRSYSGGSGGPAIIHQSPPSGRATPPGANAGGASRNSAPGAGPGILRGRRN